MELSAPVLALGKLVLVFALLIALLRLHVKLWLSIFAACVAVALTSGIMPREWPGIALGVVSDRNFIILCLMIWLIILLSSVQEAAGQSRSLVRGLERYVRSPRIRLVLFPALIGLLPMPGGALFSCPMIQAATHDMGIGNHKKALINYWFRHIWETAWPLYPGYALACSLLNISMTRLWQFTFPLVLLSFAVGWFYYMRDLAGSPLLAQKQDSGCSGQEQGGGSLGAVLLHALPIAVTLIGAGIFGFLFDLFLPRVPGQAAFSLSLSLAIGTALYQGRGRMSKPFSRMLFTDNTRRILLMLVAIFLFKDLLARSGIIREVSDFGSAPLMVVLACVLVPLLSGVLTGLLVGLVGVAFPIIIGLVEHSPLKEYMLPLMVLGLVAGNCGQIISPLHVCLVVTCEYFSSALPGVWRALLKPGTALLVGGALWAGFLALWGARF